jgi:hypothetical protein
MVTPWEKASVIISAFALFISIGAVFGASMSAVSAKNAADEANRIARDSYVLAADAARREVASKVFLGEAPPKYETNGYPIWSVSNASGVDVTRVWVEGDVSGVAAHIRIGHVQQCHLYTLSDRPNEFRPNWLHFFDGSQHWMRSIEGELKPDAKPALPNTTVVGAPKVFRMVGSCGG